MNKIILLLSIFSVLAGCATNQNTISAYSTKCIDPASSKKIIGSYVVATVGSDKLEFIAKVSSSADFTSFNGYIENYDSLETKYAKNIGKQVTAILINKEGNKLKLETKITSVKLIANAIGIQPRYSILIPVNVLGERKELEVTLADRSKLRSSVLLGRDFLKGGYLIDVTQ